MSTVRKPLVHPWSTARARLAPPPAFRALEGGTGRLLTVREAAARLAMSTLTAYGLCDRGELPHVRISNAIRIALADLAEFLAGKRSGGR